MTSRFKVFGLTLALLGAQAALAQKISVQAITQVAPNLPQYTKVDQPLLRDGMAAATQGRVEVTLASWPERNVSGPEVLRLVRSGQVDIAAAPLTTVSGDVPILDGVDLAGMNSDIRQARKVADAMMPVANKESTRPWSVAQSIVASRVRARATGSSGPRCRPISTHWRCPGPPQAILSIWPGGTSWIPPSVLNSRKRSRRCRKRNGTWGWKPPTTASPAMSVAKRTASSTPW